jgi:hypothetical protein
MSWTRAAEHSNHLNRQLLPTIACLLRFRDRNRLSGHSLFVTSLFTAIDQQHAGDGVMRKSWAGGSTRGLAAESGVYAGREGTVADLHEPDCLIVASMVDPSSPSC